MNDDLCSIDFKDFFNNEKDVLPILSFCIRNPFSKRKFTKHLPGVNESSYLNFLQGNTFNSSWMNIDYEDLITNVSEYVEQDSVTFRNGSDLYFNPEYGSGLFNGNTKYQPPLGKVYSLAVFRDSRFYNCYGFSIPADKNIQTFYFRANNSLFPSGFRSQIYSLLTILHYPNQMLYSSHTMKYAWPQDRYKNASYIMRFKISRVEVVRRRQKINNRCHENWENYDSEIMNHHVKKIGCRPVYFSALLFKKDVPLCSTQEQMKKAIFPLRSDGYGVIPPCTSMEQISYEYEESTLDPKQNSWAREGKFFLGIFNFNGYFKDIYQTR